MEVKTEIPFKLNTEELLKKIRVEPGTDDAREFEDLLNKVRKIARPKALFKECFVESRGEGTVAIGGITFTSRTLRLNLERANRVYAYIATCGTEPDRIDISGQDFLKMFWLDTIKAGLLEASIDYLNNLVTRRYGGGKIASMNPGSGDVDVWPIEQQKEMFALFGEVEELIGVRLTESFLMLPNKSVSGIFFPTGIDFRSCQLCHRERCPDRKTPFDEKLWKSVSKD